MTLKGKTGYGALLIVAAVFALIQVWCLTGPTMRGDERFYFFSADGMTQSGDWLTPKDEFSRFRVHKPPLYTWVTALAFKLGGPHLACQRAISILAALGTAYLVYLLGLLLFDSALAAALAGIMILSFTEVFLTSQQGRADALLMFLITFVNYALARILVGTEKPMAWALLAYFLAGLAFLTKGPNGLFHTLLPALAVALILPQKRGRIRYLLHPLGWRIFTVTAGPWFVALVAVHTPAIWSLIMADLARHGPEGNLIAAFIKNTGSYITIMLAKTLPWWPLLILGLISPRKTLAEDSAQERRFAFLFLAAWVGAVAVTVSFNPKAVGRYLLFFYPALALLGAGWLAGDEKHPAWIREKGMPLALAVLSSVFAAALIPLLIGYFKYGSEITDPTVFLLSSSILAVGLITLLWFFWRRGRLLGWAACLACLSILINGAYDRNYNVANNRGAVAELSAQVLAPLDPDKVRVFCLGMPWSDCVPILDRGGKRPLPRYAFGDPAGIVYDRLAFPEKGREILAVTMSHLWEKMDPELKSRFEPVEEVAHAGLIRGAGIFVRLDKRKCLLLRLKTGEVEGISLRFPKR